MPKKSVLITGITGQDGVFLTNLLLNKKETTRYMVQLETKII